MEYKTVVVTNASGMSTDKTAMLTPATGGDRARIGEGWHHPRDLKHGHAVDEVNHFGRHTTAPGDLLAVRDIQKNILAKVQVTGIRLVECERLTDSELRKLGYASRAAYMDDWGRALKGKAWFVDVMHLTPHESSEPSAGVM